MDRRQLRPLHVRNNCPRRTRHRRGHPDDDHQLPWSFHDIQEGRHVLCGQGHAPGLLFTLRPFVQQIYAAIHSNTCIQHASNAIWVKQLRHSLTWLQAFFREELEGVVRHFDVAEFLGAGAQMEVGTDASPYGIGGWLALNGVILHYFAAPITNEDTALFGHRFGHCEGQQTWEALAILVAARI